ncbi:MAG: TRAP transporter substrate-binding protein [Lachnospiraceae bacterium]|nr:TRAP transporter substrate-binding protein [Lachnospiraceae bacterium]
MKKRSRVFICVLSAMMMLSTAGCGSKSNTASSVPASTNGAASSASDYKATLKVAYNNTEEYPHYKALAWAAEELESRTDGRIKMQIYPNGTLGDQRASLEMTQNNSVDMAVVNASIIESFNPDFAILSMPYLFNSTEHQRAVYTSDILDDLFATVEENGFVIEGAFGSGSRNIFTKKAVRTPEDLKGLKIRVMQSDTMVKMLELMGGVGVPMSASEQYSAIQQGVVDGAETNEIDYIGKKFYEIAPYFSRTAHCFSTDFIVVSPKTLASLPDADRVIFDEVMDGCVEKEFDFWVEMIDEMVANSEGLGITFVDDVNTGAFKENFIDFQKEISGKSDITKKIYEEVNALQ